MRRLRLAIAPGHWTRFDCRETKASVRARRHTSVSFETRLQRLVLRVLSVSIFPVCVGLPDFQNRIRHRVAIAIKNPTLNCDALAGDELASQMVTIELLQTNFEKRTDRLRRSRVQTHLFLHRRRFTPAQDEIEVITESMSRHGCIPIEVGDQPVAGIFIGRAIENRVEWDEWI